MTGGNTRHKHTPLVWERDKLYFLRHGRGVCWCVSELGSCVCVCVWHPQRSTWRSDCTFILLRGARRAKGCDQTLWASFSKLFISQISQTRASLPPWKSTKTPIKRCSAEMSAHLPSSWDKCAPELPKPINSAECGPQVGLYWRHLTVTPRGNVSRK